MKKEGEMQRERERAREGSTDTYTSG